MKYSIRPISDRTAFTGEHKHSPFGITHTTLMDEFDRELWFLDATNVVIEVDVDDRHIRLDGMLRADAKTHSPGVRLCFDSNQGPLAYATDAFVRPSWKRGGMQQDWQHNLCAIVRGLEALRKVDRYAISRRGEQYTGWKQLPGGAPHEAVTPNMDKDLAWSIIGPYQEGPIAVFGHEASNDDMRKAYRRARAANHPDRCGGDRSAWDQVEEAARVLGLSR